MRRSLTLLLIPPLLGVASVVPTAAAAQPAPAAARKKGPDPLVISEGKRATLVDFLKPESPTVVLFYRPSQAEEQRIADDLRRRSEQDTRVTLRLVRLTDLEAPIAKQYEVEATPLAFVYDRNKNLLGKAKAFEEVAALVMSALRKARLTWVDENDPNAAEAYRIFGGGKRPVPEIMKTMSLRPELMESVAQIAQKYHFSDDFLPRKTKEMIASYVSSLNKCKY